MSVASPCVGVCRLDDGGICVGCSRSSEEIASWRDDSDDERLRILAAAAIRRKTRTGAPMNELRIVSFLPSATEMACALGLEEFVVGISHECDFPRSIRTKPVVVHSALPIETMTVAEIDVAVAQQLRNGASLYEVDERLLSDLAPTHILTQDLCQVCAPAGNEVTRVLKALLSKPEVLWMSPHSIADIHNDLRNLARLVGREGHAEQLIASDQARLEKIRDQVSDLPVRRVFCVEWIDPIYCCGHWVPEMVEIAGGLDSLGKKWADSVRVKWEDVAKSEPELVIVMPCGFDLNDSTEQAGELMRKYPALARSEIVAVDASYFSRPSLRVIDGTELLAHILHPDQIEWHGPQNAFARLQKEPAAKTCPECGATFSCGASLRNFKCWCAELPPLPKSATDERGCLCPECLLKKAGVIRESKPLR